MSAFFTSTYLRNSDFPDSTQSLRSSESGYRDQTLVHDFSTGGSAHNSAADYSTVGPGAPSPGPGHGIGSAHGSSHSQQSSQGAGGYPRYPQYDRGDIGGINSLDHSSPSSPIYSENPNRHLSTAYSTNRSSQIPTSPVAHEVFRTAERRRLPSASTGSTNAGTSPGHTDAKLRSISPPSDFSKASPSTSSINTPGTSRSTSCDTGTTGSSISDGDNNNRGESPRVSTSSSTSSKDGAGTGGGGSTSPGRLDSSPISSDEAVSPTGTKPGEGQQANNFVIYPWMKSPFGEWWFYLLLFVKLLSLALPKNKNKF